VPPPVTIATLPSSSPIAPAPLDCVRVRSWSRSTRPRPVS